jgi:hypothetical protein
MEWHPDSEDRAAWSSVGGAVMAAGVLGGIGWLAIAEPSSSHEPIWPVYAFGVVALIGLYGMLAPLLRWWPWSGGGRVARAAGPSGGPKNGGMNRLLRQSDGLRNR